MLRGLRSERGLQRKFVASKLNITPDHLNKIERGECNLTIENAEILAKLYGITIDELLQFYKGGKSKCQTGH